MMILESLHMPDRGLLDLLACCLSCAAGRRRLAEEMEVKCTVCMREGVS
jgi:hypothetical protein